MRMYIAIALIALGIGTATAEETVVHRMTAEFDYALRNRMVDRDGFWFTTYEARGHAFPNDRTLHSFDLSCIGAAWGSDAGIVSEEALCRLSGDAGVLFARLTDIKDMRGETSLEFLLHGGRGQFAGLGGRATAHRALDLSGERPTGRGTMMLRLALVATAVEGE